jgi:hypothetical protein
MGERTIISKGRSTKEREVGDFTVPPFGTLLALNTVTGRSTCGAVPVHDAGRAVVLELPRGGTQVREIALACDL